MTRKEKKSADVPQISFQKSWLQVASLCFHILDSSQNDLPVETPEWYWVVIFYSKLMKLLPNVPPTCFSVIPQQACWDSIGYFGPTTEDISQYFPQGRSACWQEFVFASCIIMGDIPVFSLIFTHINDEKISVQWISHLFGYQK